MGVTVHSSGSLRLACAGVLEHALRLLIQDDVGTVVRALKARLVGEIDVAGAELAPSLTDLGPIDEYRLYFRPVMLGHGPPFVAGPRPPLRLVSSDLVGEGMVRLTYVTA